MKNKTHTFKSSPKPGFMRRKRSIVAVTLLGMATLGTSAAVADEAGRLPLDWYTLPEDMNATEATADDDEFREGIFFRRGVDHVAKSVDRILDASGEAMDKSQSQPGSARKPANAPSDWVPWHLKEMYMDLGVNASGTAGVVTAIGEASVELKWTRIKSELARLGLTPAYADSPVYEEKPDLRMSEYTTLGEITSQVDRIVETVMATGRVTNRGAMREGLLKVATDLQSVMTDINSYNESSWDIDKFGLDVEIGLSGKVGTGMTAGGAVRLRFEWKRQNYGAPMPEPEDGNGEKREELRRLLANVASDMDSVSRDTFASSGFELKTLRLGLGLYGSAKFGAVKGKASLTGYAFLNKSASKANHFARTPPRIIPDEPVALIDDEPNAKHIKYADENQIKYDRIPGGDNATDRVVYYMTREKFRQGLNRAAKMGAFFAKRAAERTGEKASRKWEVTQVKPAFALSLEGALKVVTIGGKASLEMTFKR